MKPETHRRNYTEIAAASSKGPEQVAILRRAGKNEPPIGEDNLGLEQIIQTQTEPCCERAVAASQDEASHPHRSDVARHQR